MRKILIFVVMYFLGTTSIYAKNLTIYITSASNFAPTLEKLSKSFSKKSEYQIVVTQGATGMLYTQIMQGAPFDIFFSADVTRAQKLEENGGAILGSRYTYAIGQLALWYPDNEVEISKEILQEQNVKYIAIANPKLAPYGMAAKEALLYMGFWHDKKEKLLQGNNISQSFHFIANNKKVVGFVALSQLLKQSVSRKEYWVVPNNYYSPIKQQVVVLKNSKGVVEFMEFLESDIAKNIIINDGYKIGEER